jgi:cold shock CspA family protein
MPRARMRGTVRQFRDKFGFIKPDGAPHDLFFHRGNLVDDTTNPVKGDRVSFNVDEIIRDGRGRAENVRIVSDG